jgi:8-oxo-dGTP pyrophosphatase MutT (NUDIX family)
MSKIGELNESIPQCDNRSVGVIVQNARGELALLTRRKFPAGISPPAGHVDDHGTSEQAAVEEVGEEIGVELAVSGLRRTAIASRRVENVCRRPGGDHHVWDVYEATVTSNGLNADPEETQGARWYSRPVVEALARRTRAYLDGTFSQEDFQNHPGIEPVWLPFLEELGYVSK